MLLLGKTQEKHPGDLPPMVPDLPPASQIAENFIDLLVKQSNNIHNEIWCVVVLTTSINNVMINYNQLCQGKLQ